MATPGQFIEQSMMGEFERGQALSDQRKQAARDLQFQNNFDQLQNDEKNLQLKYSTTLDKAGKPTADSQQWLDALANNHAAQRNLYDQFIHPSTNPGALQRLGGWIAGRLHITHPAPSVTTEVGAITVPGSSSASSAAPLNPYKNPEEQPPADSFALNKQWAKTGSYTTKLSPEEEAKFQEWAKTNKIPWQDSATADYDMRGYWKALTNPNYPNHELAQRAPNGHFPDMWKTPYSGVFSRESMYAMPGAPEWKGDNLYTADGRLVVGAPQSAAEGTSAQGQVPLGVGSAVSLPGHKVTVSEVPQKQFDKQQALEAKNLAADRAAAQQAAMGAPIGPLQASVLQANADATKWLGLYQQKVDELRKADPNMSAEDAQRSALELMGVRVPLSYGQPQLWQLADGTQAELRFSPSGGVAYADGTPVDPDLMVGARQLPKPTATPHTILNQEQDAYAKSYGFKDFSEIPEGLQYAAQQYVQQRAKLDTQFGRATRSTTLKQDISGNEIPVTVWNYSTPTGGLIKLEDPLSGLYPHADVPSAPGTAPSPTPTGGAARSVTAPPRPSAHMNAPKPLGVQGSQYAKAGSPVFLGRTPATDLDFKNLKASEAAYNDVLKESTNTTPVDSQDMVMTWLKGRVNRVTATEIQAVRNLGGAFQKFDGNVSSILHGTMTPEQISWFVKSAKERYEVAKEQWQNDVSEATSAPDTQPTGGFDWNNSTVAPVHEGGR